MIQTKLNTIVSELSTALKEIDNETVDKVVTCITEAPNIYAAGVGRSGYMMRAFAMRLMHGNLNAYVVGDTATPGAKEGDLLILGSGSGETESLKAYAAKARKLGMKIITVTSFPDSALGKAADIVLQLSAPTPKSEKSSKFTSIQPMANLFEQSLLITLDALSMEIMEAKHLDGAVMFGRHANLE